VSGTPQTVGTDGVSLAQRVAELEQRLDTLAKTNAALVQYNEVVLLVLAADIDDETKQGLYQQILAAVKLPALLADAEQALEEGAREGRARRMRELLQRARG
jgi:hypothetical protein